MWRNFKTQIVMKLKNSNCDETQKLKLQWNSKTQTVMKLKSSNCDKNSNVEKTQKLKLWQKSKTQIVTKLKLWQKSNYAKTQMLWNSNCDKTLKLKLWQNSNTQTVAKLKNKNCDKTQIMIKLKMWRKIREFKIWQN